MAKLRKGDTVIVIAGKDKGKQGTVQVVKTIVLKLKALILSLNIRSQIRRLALKAAFLSKKLFTYLKRRNFKCANPKSRPYYLPI